MHITSLLSVDVLCSLLPLLQTLLILESKDWHGCSLLWPGDISKLSLILLNEASDTGKHALRLSFCWVAVDANGLCIPSVEVDAAETSILLLVCETVVSDGKVALQLFKSLAFVEFNSLALAEFNKFK